MSTSKFHNCFILGIAILLAGCDQNSPKDAKPSALPVSPLTGIKRDSLEPFVVGDDFEQVLNAISITWWDEGLDECNREMALKGCRLPAYLDSGVRVKEGMAFRPTLYFGNTGKLSSVQYNYRIEGKISQDECTELFGRVKLMIEKFAAPLFPLTRPLGASDIAAGWKRLAVKTINGANVMVSTDGSDVAFYVTSVGGPSLKSPVRSVDDIKGLYISVSGHYISSGSRKYCSLSYDLTDNSLPLYRFE